MIMLWFGAVDNVPSGWHLCDGSVGTPDLRNKFVPGAGDTYDPNDTGGADSQTHPFTGNGHAHVILAGNEISDLPPAGHHTHTTSSVAAAGTTDAADNRPQFHALAYIMKL